MSEQSKQIARRFLDAFAKGDRGTLETIVSDDLVDHNAPPGQKPGRQGLIDAVSMYRSAFPDMTITVEHLVAGEECVAATGKVIGTNRGSMMGMPATGKTATFAYMDMYRIVNGRVTEVWHVEDVAGMLRQLGMAPA